MTSITDQKYDLRCELRDLMQDFISLSTEKTHLYITLELVGSAARKMTLKELAEWRDRLKGEVVKLKESET